MKKKLIILCIVMVWTLTSFAATAKEILLSKDVLAHLSNGELYLLDMVGFVETKIDSTTYDFAWDKAGRNIYTLELLDDYAKDKLSLDVYKISLPFLQKTKLQNLPLPRKRDKDSFVESRIYLNYDAAFTIVSYYSSFASQCQWQQTLDPLSRKFTPAVCDSFDVTQDSYLPAGYNRIYTEGFGIQNRILAHDRDTSYNELFINQAEPGEPEDYVRLTYIDSLRADYYPFQRDIIYTFPPDYGMIVFGYEYMSTYELGTMTCAILPDGSNQTVLRDNLLNGKTTDYGWLSDNRLVYIGFCDDAYSTLAIYLLDNQGIRSLVRHFAPRDKQYRLLYRYPDVQN